LLRQLDQAVEKNRLRNRLGAFAVFLGEGNRAELQKRLQGLAGDMEKGLRHVVLAIDSPDSDSGLKKYPLDKDARVVVLLYARHKVLANHTFREGLTAEGVKTVLKDVAEKFPSAGAKKAG
jgi:hypothetical protein